MFYCHHIPLGSLCTKNLINKINIEHILHLFLMHLQVVLSLKLCNNFHIYSGLTFQVARRCNKKIDVLASGGSYDSLFETFRQLDGRHHDRRHGVGVSISLDKVEENIY